MKANTYCIDTNCSYWRNVEDLYSELVATNENLRNKIFGFRSFIAAE